MKPSQEELDAAYYRLVDETWLENAELMESLAQMRRGEKIRADSQEADEPGYREGAEGR